MKFNFKLNTTEIKVLRQFTETRENSLGRIMEVAGISYPALARIISSLANKGFLQVSKKGISRQVSLSDTKHAQLFKSVLSEFKHMNLEKVLGGSSLETLSHMNEAPLKRMELEKLTGLTAKTVKVTLKRFREVGLILIQDRSKYVLNKRFSLLEEFVKEFRRYYNQRLAEEFSEDSTIIWQMGKEFLIRARSQKEGEGFFLTGISRFHQYGITLFLPDYNYFFYSPYKSKLSVEDIILHAIRADPNGTRTILSALLLWKKNEPLDMRYLCEEAKKYQIDDATKALIEYLKSEGKAKPEYFPTWTEYYDKTKEYMET